MAIIHYLEDLSGSNNTLFPGDLSERNKARSLQIYSNSLIGKELREVIFEKRNKPEQEWDIERINEGELGWRRCLDWLEQQLESTDHFLASGFSVADAALLPRFALAEKYGVGVDQRHPRLHDWYKHQQQGNRFSVIEI